MKKVTASEARKHWFHLLDEVIEGQAVVIERRGRRVVMRREDSRSKSGSVPATGYRRLLQVPQADAADRWSWQWRRSGDLRPVTRPAR